MEIVVLALPSMVGYIFSAILYQRKCRTLAERFMLMFMVVISTFLLFDAYTVYPHAYSPAKVICLILNALNAPCIGITICFVGWSLHAVRQRYRRPFLAFYLFAFLVFVAELLNYFGFGLERAADYYANDRMYPPECKTDTFLYHIYGTFEFMAIYVYNLVCIVTFFNSIVYLIYLNLTSDFNLTTLYNFLFRRGPLRVLHIWSLSLLGLYVFTAYRIVYGSPYLTKNPDTCMWLYVLAAVSMVVMGFASLQLRKPCVYLLRPHKQPIYEDVPVTIIDPHEFSAHMVEDESSFDTDEEADNYRTLNIRDDLYRLMRDQAPYLCPGQSRYFVAEMLGLRRDALDRTMRILFHISYEEYVMVQRIEYCRRYRDHYTNESEVEISIACGFVSLKEMQYEWRECRTYFRRADKLLEEEKRQRASARQLETESTNS